MFRIYNIIKLLFLVAIIFVRRNFFPSAVCPCELNTVLNGYYATDQDVCGNQVRVVCMCASNVMWTLRKRFGGVELTYGIR